MLCKKPYRQGVAEFGCGQCLPCRINRRELWTTRLLLEARTHVWSWFVTLTYADEHLPADLSVSRRELQLFLKKLRRNCATKVRFYAVGEYGGLTARPHYHLIAFGVPDPCHIPPRDVEVLKLPPCACVFCKSWSKGGVDVREVAPETASYLVKYHTDAKRKRGTPRIEGRAPEFATMSNGGGKKTGASAGGIGAQAIPLVAEAMKNAAGEKYLRQTGDVPAVVRWAKRVRPLGRYLRSRLRKELGMAPSMPTIVQEALSMRMQEELRVPGAREKRESQRQATAARAEALNNISISKKGVGL